MQLSMKGIMERKRIMKEYLYERFVMEEKMVRRLLEFCGKWRENLQWLTLVLGS